MLHDRFAQHLEQLRSQNRLRQFTHAQPQGKYIIRQQQTLLNLSSNDYLGIAGNTALHEEFADTANAILPLGSASSRLLTGNFPVYQALEQALSSRFQRETALLFNSGYHANIGILPALADKNTLILADKLVHASIIDGIRLSGTPYLRYRHNDYAHLQQLLEQHSPNYELIIIVTESLFSMDGDCADLRQLVQFKRQFGNIMLYVDEAHAVGAYGKNGLGLAEVQDCVADIDLLVGTFGKAVGSVGAYLVCDELIRDYLVNTARPLIFSTALPPLNIAWTLFVWNKLPSMNPQRLHLADLSQRLRQAIDQRFQTVSAHSHIVPCILGTNQAAVETAQQWQQLGYYCLPVRPPTVPQHTARVRLSLNTAIQTDELDEFIRRCLGCG